MPRPKPPFQRLNRSHPLAQGLVFNEGFFEGSGLTLTDLVSNRIGTIQASSGTTWGNGLFGKQLNFTAAVNPIRVPTTPALNVTTTFSMVAVINPAAFATVQTILAKSWGDDDSGTFSGAPNFNIQTNGKLRFTVRKIADIDDTGSQALVANTYNVIAYTHSGTNYNFYINGLLNSTIVNASAVTSNALDLIIGDNNRTQRFNGAIIFLGLWNRLLSAQEIAQITADPFQIYRKKSFALKH